MRPGVLAGRGYESEGMLSPGGLLPRGPAALVTGGRRREAPWPRPAASQEGHLGIG